ncbi:MAG: RHS repeat-associated core domain-containing protein [Chloroflexota bacterium]
MDLTPPTVSLTLPPVVPLRFNLTWPGDDGAGSGLRGYNVHYRVEGQVDWTPWLTGTGEPQAEFVGLPGEVYTFRAQAVDNVNNPGGWLAAGPVTIASVTKYYTFGGQRVAMRQGDVVYYLHGDHLGSTSLTTDQAGEIVAETRYLPYGEERWTGDTSQPTDFTFTGQRKDGFGLMDYNARYYSPYLNRFISPDSMVPEPWHSGAFNRYTYANNNPVRNTDPTGHQCGPACLPAPPPQIPWQELARLAGPLAAAAPEAAIVVAGSAAIAAGLAAGTYGGSTWAMQDMGPSNPANPWTGGWTETFPLGEGDTPISVTPPLPGTSTLGTEGPPTLTTPLEEPKTFGLEFPSLDTNELPELSILESKVIQTGGHTIRSGTAQALNKYNDLNLHSREWGRALEALKDAFDLPNNHHGKIYEDGTYTDDEGNEIGNLLDYLP